MRTVRGKTIERPARSGTRPGQQAVRTGPQERTGTRDGQVPLAPGASDSSTQSVALAELVRELPLGRGRLGPAALRAVTALVAGRPATWLGSVEPNPEARVYTRLFHAEELEIWLLGWEGGQETTWHDHGGSSGSFRVVEGDLVEELRLPAGRVRRRTLGAGDAAAFGPGYAHNVVREHPGPALSIHAYSPALRTMTYYERTPLGLSAIATRRVDGPDEPFDRSSGETAPAELGAATERDAPTSPTLASSPQVATFPPPFPTTVDRLLETARTALVRTTPVEAADELARGALLVDTRPLAQRLRDGEVPGAVVVERNVLEWRLDPTSDARLGVAGSPDLRVIVMCDEGYASTLAAITLRQLGLHRATDLEGGFQAWRRAGLPVRPAAVPPDVLDHLRDGARSLASAGSTGTPT